MFECFYCTVQPVDDGDGGRLMSIPSFSSDDFLEMHIV